MDKYDAMSQIRELASEHNLCVAIITTDDVFDLLGIENPTNEQTARLVDSYEWRHYGDDWAEYWAEYFDDAAGSIEGDGNGV